MGKNHKTLQAKNGKISTKSKAILKNGSKKSVAPKKKQVKEEKKSSKTQQPKEMWDYFALDAKYSKL